MFYLINVFYLTKHYLIHRLQISLIALRKRSWTDDVVGEGVDVGRENASTDDADAGREDANTNDVDPSIRSPLLLVSF